MNHPFGGYSSQLHSRVERFFGEYHPHEKYFFDHTRWDEVVSLGDKPEYPCVSIDLRETWQNGLVEKGRIGHVIEESDYKLYAGRALVEVETTMWFVDRGIKNVDRSGRYPVHQLLCPTADGRFRMGWTWVEDAWLLYRFEYWITPYEGLRDYYGASLWTLDRKTRRTNGLQVQDKVYTRSWAQ